MLPLLHISASFNFQQKSETFIVCQKYLSDVTAFNLTKPYKEPYFTYINPEEPPNRPSVITITLSYGPLLKPGVLIFTTIVF